MDHVKLHHHWAKRHLAIKEVWYIKNLATEKEGTSWTKEVSCLIKMKEATEPEINWTFLENQKMFSGQNCSDISSF